VSSLLLDTHIALWWLADEELSAEARALITDAEDVFVSAASVWEAGIKATLGKLRIDVPLAPVIESVGIAILPITGTHADRAAHLPPLHRDPFDRMLVAQAQLESLTLVTRDPKVLAYDVATHRG
jgi:PIN domain nuclease of toxin-antitoxin system